MKKSDGKLVFLDGEAYYKIENFDCMSDFFMTLTSSSDVWNFCWAQGGITAGRKNSSYPIFPYYTCDKLQDTKSTTGAVTIIKIKSDEKKGLIWQPFRNLFYTGTARFNEEIGLQRNLYKNLNGSKIWFEEINLVTGLSFRYGWTSSKKYGLIKSCRIENLTEQKVKLEILDGCRNIMPSSADESIQNTKSVLLDAYKKSEIDSDFNVALFTLSSVLTDKAEPSESLKTNVSWFTTDDKIILSDKAIEYFVTDKISLLDEAKELNGKRGECYIIHESRLLGKSAECWEQIIDVDYDYTRLVQLEEEIKDRSKAFKLVLDDIEKTENELSQKIAASDGVQKSRNEIADLHHRTNVMFNIMRGGILNDEGKIDTKDFIAFAKIRNKKEGAALQTLLKDNQLINQLTTCENLKKIIFDGGSSQLKRLFLEYIPLTFSRRHGDPSRPWNKFNIDVTDENGRDRINWEGNWRDIFQNWEALLWSYPQYIPNAVSIFLNAMTAEGFNPYRITKNGIDWEIPEKGNPWAQFGYWGDHQVIYFQKFLELFNDYNSEQLLEMMNEKLFSTANIPYVIKKYADICKDPRNSIYFDYEKDSQIKALEKEYGFDARLILENDSVQLTSMVTKILQIILAKVLNHIPGAGIWMNTQRPEWNDANNALAGWGTSVVTMCYLYRMLSFLSKLFKDSGRTFQINKITARTLLKAEECYSSFAKLLKNSAPVTDKERKSFTDSTGLIFEEERNSLSARGFSQEYESINGKKLSDILKVFKDVIEYSIRENKRSDGLYHSYNSIVMSNDEIKVINLKLMLEGQVAILSSGLLNHQDVVELCKNLKESDLFEKKQYSYMLYPVSKLPSFKNKNLIAENEISGLEKLIQKTGNLVLSQDMNGSYHFNASFKNADVMKEFFNTLPEEQQPDESEAHQLLNLYEKHFNHQQFTGRSGTFYRYEGLGCIYWHMVSKLLLAVQENITDTKDELFAFYKDVKKGLGAAKTPEEYGAFPFDPYSHTPYQKGACQPGMTGQVKEEIIARFRELGLSIKDGRASFNPQMIENSEYSRSSKVHFTWCGTPVTYNKKQAAPLIISYKDGNKKTFDSTLLTVQDSQSLFERRGNIEEISVGIKS